MSNNNVRKTQYSQQNILDEFLKEPDVKKGFHKNIKDGFCGGITTADIINFLEENGKPYPLSNPKDAKEALYIQNEYLNSQDKDYPVNKITSSNNNVPPIKNSLKQPTPETITGFFSDEFYNCKDTSHKISNDKDLPCAKYLRVLFNDNTAHAISLKRKHNYCSFSDPNAPQLEGNCKDVPGLAAQWFLANYEPQEIKKIKTFTFNKNPDKTETKGQQNETKSHRF